jgi:hypothetical protein
VLAAEAPCGVVHRVDVERCGHVPRTGGDQRARVGRVPHVVAVLPPPCREAGVELFAHRFGAAHGDRRRAQLVDPAGEVGEVGAVRQLDGDDLPPGVHAGIGAPRAGEYDGRPDDGRDRLGQRAGDGGDAGVAGKAVKPGAVIGDDQPDVHDLGSDGVGKSAVSRPDCRMMRGPPRSEC